MVLLVKNKNNIYIGGTSANLLLPGSAFALPTPLLFGSGRGKSCSLHAIRKSFLDEKCLKKEIDEYEPENIFAGI